MKGLILMSARYAQAYPHDRYDVFFKQLSKDTGFPFIYTDQPEVPKDTDVVIVGFQRTYTNSMMNLAILNKNIKMIGILGDIHSLGNMPGNDIKMLDRYDIILGFNEVFFKNLYPKYIDKYAFFPQFFAPVKRYTSLPINKNPIMKCLLIGNLNPEWMYPFRNWISKKRNPAEIDVLSYPGTFLKKMKTKKTKKYFINDEYAQKMNSYFCNLVTSGYCMNVMAKFLEAPASGTLMIGEVCPDLAAMGLLANKHYIPITKQDVFLKVSQCLKDPLKYEEIRKNGTDFVRKYHSVENRLKTLKELIYE